MAVKKNSDSNYDFTAYSPYFVAYKAYLPRSSCVFTRAGAFSCAGACWRLAGNAFISEQTPAGAGATERDPDHLLSCCRFILPHDLTLYPNIVCLITTTTTTTTMIVILPGMIRPLSWFRRLENAFLQIPPVVEDNTEAAFFVSEAVHGSVNGNSVFFSGTFPHLYEPVGVSFKPSQALC